MKERGNQFYENEAFVASMYLDPRFHMILKEGQLKKAKKHLSDLYDRLIRKDKISEEQEEEEGLNEGSKTQEAGWKKFK